MSHADVILEKLDLLESRLVSRGWPPMSPWWRKTFTDFYRSGKKQLVVRAGRRGGKSSSISRIGVLEALYGQHKIPPGDIGFVPVVSTKKAEAQQRLFTITGILTTLGVKHTVKDDTIYVKGLPVAFRVFTASIAGVSGFTSIFVFCDEVAKWRDADTGANPASQVLTSIRPTMATQREARMVLSSSPFSVLDAHYDAFEAGDSDHQMVAYAPTWEANPSLTETDTLALEPDGHMWAREYKAVPQTETEDSLLTQAEYDRCVRKGPLVLPYSPLHSYVATMDPATRGDRWTLVIGTSSKQKTVVAKARYWQGSRSAPLDPRTTLRDILADLREYKIDEVWTDQYHGDSLRALGEDIGLNVTVVPSTHKDKIELYEALKTDVAAEQLEFPPDADMRADLLSIRRCITRSGFTIDLPHVGGRHCDYAPPIALLAGRHIDDPRITGPEKFTADWEREQQEKRRKEWADSREPKSFVERTQGRFHMPTSPWRDRMVDRLGRRVP